MKVLPEPIQFNWDEGNKGKNKKHGVKDNESEEAFFDKSRKMFKDKLHSGKEARYRIIGKTKEGRLLFIAFTVREKKIRIISARNINRKEVHLYEETT